MPIEVSWHRRNRDLESLNTNELTEMNLELEQKVAGIGVALKAADGGVIVGQTPLPGSPALKAGILVGDRIVRVNGNELPLNNLAGAVKLLRGPVGTPVTLGVKLA